MPAFSDINALKISLKAANLDRFVEPIIATTKPCLQFRRDQELFGTDNLTTSRIGGLPCLPPTFEWPTRPAFVNAQELAEESDRALEITLNSMSKEVWNETLNSMKEYLPAENIEAMEFPYTPDLIAAIRRESDSKRKSYFEPMPLSFVCQLNLSDLATHDGFDEVLPTEGFLFFFQDVTSDLPSGQVVYLNSGLDQLEARPIPRKLIDFAAKQSFVQTPLEEASRCEVLHARSMISVPSHWNREKYGPELIDWLIEGAHELHQEAGSETSAH